MNEGRMEIRGPLKDSFLSAVDHRIHGDIVGLGKCVRHSLAGEADADFLGIGAGLGEDTIIESIATTEAPAIRIEGETGAEKGVDLDFRDERMGWRTFHDSKAAGSELGSGISDRVESERVAVDARVSPSDFGMAGDEIYQIDLAREWRKDGDGFESGVFTKPFVQGVANRL